MSRPRLAVAHAGQVTLPEHVTMYRWFCPECNLGGTIPATPGETPEEITARAENSHARKSPGCRWDDEAVKLCRLHP